LVIAISDPGHKLARVPLVDAAVLAEDRGVAGLEDIVRRL
jgi:hypothetical protein